MQFIDLKKQYSLIENKINEGIKKVLEHGQYILGPEVKTFESMAAEYVGADYCISCASGTDALMMALMAIGIQPGDEVITTPFSFFATAEVIALCHATPVFVDIDPVTYNIDPSKIEAAITERTRAIIPVSLYGICTDMDAVNEIANRHQLTVIEDAAQSFGAEYKGRKSCAVSHIGCTSFFPSKPLGAYGDAGACFTSSEEIAKKLEYIRVHGQEARYTHTHIGLNARMDTIQAAVLIEKLNIFAEEVILRQDVAKRYNDLLKGICRTPAAIENQTSVYAQYTIEVEDREQVQKVMAEKGVPTAVHYPISMHMQPALQYLGYKQGDFPHSEKASERVMSLPMHPYLTLEEQKVIVDALKTAINMEVEVA